MALEAGARCQLNLSSHRPQQAKTLRSFTERLEQIASMSEPIANMMKQNASMLHQNANMMKQNASTLHQIANMMKQNASTLHHIGNTSAPIANLPQHFALLPGAYLHLSTDLPRKSGCFHKINSAHPEHYGHDRKKKVPDLPKKSGTFSTQTYYFG
jgi:hypothetical protein